MSRISERLRTESEKTSSNISLASDKNRSKIEEQATFKENTDIVNAKTGEKDKLIQTETMETGRVRHCCNYDYLIYHC